MDKIYAFFNLIGAAFNSLSMARIGQSLALAVIITIIVALYKLHTDKNNEFNFSDLFLNPNTKKIEGSMFRMNIAFFVSNWVLIYVTLNGNLSEWLFAAYLTAWVADRKFSRNAAAATPIIPGLPPVPSPTVQPTAKPDESEN